MVPYFSARCSRSSAYLKYRFHTHPQSRLGALETMVRVCIDIGNLTEK